MSPCQAFFVTSPACPILHKFREGLKEKLAVGVGILESRNIRLFHLEFHTESHKQEFAPVNDDDDLSRYGGTSRDTYN